jgi:hypothetical protein
MSRVPTIVRGVQHQVLLSALLLASSSVLLLSGCGAALNLKPGAGGSAPTEAMTGLVHGGQAPIQGAVVSLYEIGATSTSAGGYNAALGTPLGTSAATDVNGNWSIPSPTACTNPNDQLYLVAAGGAQVGNVTTPNPYLVMTTVGGPCNAQFTTHFFINELSTIATEYALSGFSSDHLHVGTSTTNTVGLVNAFATVQNLVNLSTGNAQSITPAYQSNPSSLPPDTYSSIAPADAMNTLGNILAGCVNDDNIGGSSFANCQSLFSYTGGSNSWPVGSNSVQGPAQNNPTTNNTADAILYIAHNPGLPSASGPAVSNNVGLVFALPAPQAPFASPLLTAPPNDWALTINFTGGGLGGATTTTAAGSNRLSIDQQGNIWVPTRQHAIVKLTNLGAPLSNSSTATTAGGFLGVVTTPSQIAFDSHGNAWISDASAAGCLVSLTPAGTPNGSSPFVSVCPAGKANLAIGVSVDANDNPWVVGTTYLTMANNSGVLQSGFPITTGFNLLNGWSGADYAGNTWVTDKGSNSVYAFSTTGTKTFGATTLLSGTGTGAALGLNNGTGNNGGLTLAVAEPASIGYQEVMVTTAGGVTPPALQSGGEMFYANPSGTALTYPVMDGASKLHWANNGTIPTNLTYVQVYDSHYNQVSPSPNAYIGASEWSGLYKPQDMSVDQSGNLWVVNQNSWEIFNTGTLGPYAGTYLNTSATNVANVTEFVGFSIPANPTLSADAKNQTYGVKP